MNAQHLSVVRAGQTAAEPSDFKTPAARAARLYAEAQGAALEQVRALEESLSTVAALAQEIAAGGDIYPVGVRELCRRLGEDVVIRSQTLEAIAQRTVERR